jgi:chondroitin sulfate proteoglycan 4
MVIDIIPNVITIDTLNFLVDEGGDQIIDNRIIEVRHNYFRKQNLQFFIVKAPMHGRIVNNEDSVITQFSYDLLENYKISYIHDGSDTRTDKFVIQARLDLEGKQSNPHTVRVAVKSINDQPPHIVRNEQLMVWGGSSAPITRDILVTEDNDTPPEFLMYTFKDLTQGCISLASRPTELINNFTQAHIDRGEVIFTHKGK